MFFCYRMSLKLDAIVCKGRSHVSRRKWIFEQLHVARRSWYGARDVTMVPHWVLWGEERRKERVRLLDPRYLIYF